MSDLTERLVALRDVKRFQMPQTGDMGLSLRDRDTLAEAVNELEAKDPDYSRSIQDAYAEHWHKAAAENKRLRDLARELYEALKMIGEPTEYRQTSDELWRIREQVVRPALARYEQEVGE